MFWTLFRLCSDSVQTLSWEARETWETCETLHFVDLTCLCRFLFLWHVTRLTIFKLKMKQTSKRPISFLAHFASTRETLPNTSKVLLHKSDNKSLISADRNNKATLLLTILRCTFKSSASDLSLRVVTLRSVGRVQSPFRQWKRVPPAMTQGQKPYLCLLKHARQNCPFEDGFWLRGVQPLTSAW